MTQKRAPIRSKKLRNAAREIARVKMLAAIERLPRSKYRCRCDCGNERIVNVGHFNTGVVKSCGCTKFRKDVGAHGACIVEGCDGQRCNSKGWCWMHYTRWRRHGDPLHCEIGKPREWLDAHINYSGDDCLTWPFGGRPNGYGTLIYDGVQVSASRKMCELVNGGSPSRTHEAAHSCGKGHEGCVNPRHLSWKTPTENQADKLIHGTHNRGERNGSAVLTARLVKAMRREYRFGNTTYSKLADKYDAPPAAVKCAVSGRTWAWLE